MTTTTSEVDLPFSLAARSWLKSMNRWRTPAQKWEQTLFDGRQSESKIKYKLWWIVGVNSFF